MTRELKWRIIAMQGMAIIVLGFCAGFLYTESTFVTGMVNDQLAAQNITFPDRDTLVNAKNPDGTAEYTNLVIQYAGQKVDNGDKAYAYGNGFIGVHLHNIANGMTYSEVSAAAAKDPTNTKLAGQKTPCSRARCCARLCSTPGAGRNSASTPCTPASGRRGRRIRPVAGDLLVNRVDQLVELDHRGAAVGTGDRLQSSRLQGVERDPVVEAADVRGNGAQHGCEILPGVDRPAVDGPRLQVRVAASRRAHRDAVFGDPGRRQQHQVLDVAAAVVDPDAEMVVATLEGMRAGRGVDHRHQRKAVLAGVARRRDRRHRCRSRGRVGRAAAAGAGAEEHQSENDREPACHA